MDETDASADAKIERAGDAERGEAGEADDEDGSSDPELSPLGAGVITIASERRLDSDEAGEAIVTALKRSGHEIATREHIDTDHDQVQSIVSRMIDRDDVDIVITGGATGVEPDDVTIEAVEPLLEKEITAFSELFTVLAYEAVDTRAIAARTLAGVADDVPVFCLPGDGDAARLGIDEIILPEARHLIDLARGDEREPESESGGDETDAEGEKGSEGENTDGNEGEGE